MSVSSVCLVTPGALFSTAPAGAGSAINAVTAMAAQVASILDIGCFSSRLPPQLTPKTPSGFAPAPRDESARDNDWTSGRHAGARRHKRIHARLRRAMAASPGMTAEGFSNTLTPYPPAVHAWRHHGTARAMLLDIAGNTFALGVGTWVFVPVRHRIDRVEVPVRIDRPHPQPGPRAARLLRPRIGCRSGSDTRCSGLRKTGLRGEQTDRQRDNNCGSELHGPKVPHRRRGVN